MRNIRKRLLITGVIIVMGLSATGCTKMTEATKDKEVSGVEAEDLPGDGNGSGKPDGGDGAAADAAGDGEAQGAENPGQEAGAGDEDPSGEDISSLRYIPEGEGDLLGDICEVGDMQFTVTEIYTENVDDGMVMTSIAPEAGEDASKITVVYDENTVFEKQKIWNGGANHEEKPATAANLQEGFTAEMWGSYEGDVFHATAIKIVEVILQ